MTKSNLFQRILTNRRIILGLWIVATIVFTIQALATHRYNNYLIFEWSFFHLTKGVSLYASYPGEYFDAFHSAPLFAVLMAPFAIMPDWLGLLCWNLLNVLGLFWVIQLLPLKQLHKVLICWLALPDIVGSTLSEQFNPMLTVFILLSYILIRKGNLFWAAFFIVAGTLTKLYGIVGLAFFFFTPRQLALAGYLLLWGGILFALPMLFSSPAYIIHTYTEWLSALTEKNSLNISLTSTQDLSVMGLFRRIFGDPNIPSSPFILAGMLLFGSVYMHVKKFKETDFQLFVLAAALISPVIFSTGSEDVTYILAVVGAGIYFAIEKNVLWRNVLLAMIIFVSIVPLWTILPVDFRVKHPFIYVFKVIPYLLVWLTIIVNLHRRELRVESYELGVMN